MILGLSGIHIRLKKIDSTGDPLVMLKRMTGWKMFRAKLETIRENKAAENSRYPGRKPYDVIPMFKMLILQVLYNLSDDSLEMQVLDRLPFMRFLDLGTGGTVPDAKTV